MLIPTIDLSRNVGGEGRSCWMAGQLRHLEKKASAGTLESAYSNSRSVNKCGWGV